MAQTGREYTTGEGTFFSLCTLSFFLSLPPSLSPSCFLALSSRVKENHLIVFIVNYQSRTPCKPGCLSNAGCVDSKTQVSSSSSSATAQYTSILCGQPVNCSSSGFEDQSCLDASVFMKSQEQHLLRVDVVCHSCS